jgi:amino acid adenylation domain-containing protein
MKNRFDRKEIEQSIVARFEKQVQLFPGRPAVRDVQRSLSFAEFNSEVNRIASVLLEISGSGQEAVAVLCEHGISAMIAIFSVLKAGKYYVPLDPLYPEKTLKHMMADSGAAVILSDGTTVATAHELAKTGGAAVVNMEAVTASLAGGNPGIEPGPDALACILYTSGSTGLPKGIMHSHRSILHHIRSHSQTFSLCENDRQALLLSYGFAASVSEIFGALLNGASLSLNYVRKTGLENLAKWLMEERITAFKLPISLFRMFLTLMKEGHDFPDLRLIVLGGDTLFRKDVELFRRFFPEKTILVNRLTSTEAFTVSRLIIDGGYELSERLVPVGYADEDKEISIIDDAGCPAETGQIGEIVVTSRYLSPGYWKLPEENSQRFTFNIDRLGRSVYRTGDLGRLRQDGVLEYFGRKDSQVKVRGYRVELSAVEAALNALDAIKSSAVKVHESGRRQGGSKLVAYLVPAGHPPPSSVSLRRSLAETLPDYMIPGNFVVLDKIPLTPTGKVDRLSLPSPAKLRPLLGSSYVEPRTQAEKEIAAIWSEALDVEKIGAADNFFDLGGDSLALFWVHIHLRDIFALDISMTNLFQYPTVTSLARFIEGKRGDVHAEGINTADGYEGKKLTDKRQGHAGTHEEIAIIGMSGVFPGAGDIDEFWENIKNGVVSIRRYTNEELIEAGVSEEMLRHPDYVKAGLLIDGVGMFDAPFFGMSDAEAAVLDPQHRLMLETAWHALEHAGYTPDSFTGRIGFFAGASAGIYLQQHIAPGRALLREVSDNQIRLSNDPEFLATRVAYKLNLTGPAINVATACSTSLVAVHLACRSLAEGECEIALAGGVSLEALQKTGYLYQEGWLFSPDGMCRPFDDQARGTVIGSGAGLVVLKRLGDAVADGDTIHAVIKGSSVNNDGSFKMGFTAPGVDGQAAVIIAAQRNAGVTADSIGYLEAHGTGTALGDPIEITALTQAFRRTTKETAYCAVGSVKANIGHAGRAAGIAGLIKAVLALKHATIPPLAGFEHPNPEIDFPSGPFFVNIKTENWQTRDGRPRRAGVSSFGIGGTNAHMIVEEWINGSASGNTKPGNLLLLSAATKTGLEAARAGLLDYLKINRDQEMADIAYTLQVGRRGFDHRLFAVCSDRDDAIRILESASPPPEYGLRPYVKPSIVMAFSGEDMRYLRITGKLYGQEPLLRSYMDYCAGLIKNRSGLDLQQVLVKASQEKEDIETGLTCDEESKVFVFAAQYSLARLLMGWGVYPDALVGYGAGEYAAACVSGIMKIEDAVGALIGRNFGGITDEGTLQHPVVPFVSGMTGAWLKPEEAQNPDYWRHALSAGFNASGVIETLSMLTEAVLVDIRTGNAVKSMKESESPGDMKIVPLLPLTSESECPREELLQALGKLWLKGVAVDWARLHSDEKRRRVPLPVYPFERKRCWIPKGG